jgi:hypothetical protein
VKGENGKWGEGGMQGERKMGKGMRQGMDRGRGSVRPVLLIWMAGLARTQNMTMKEKNREISLEELGFATETKARIIRYPFTYVVSHRRRRRATTKLASGTKPVALVMGRNIS